MNKEELMRKYHYGYQTACKLVESQYVKDLNKEIERLTAESTEWESKCYKYQDIINELEKVLNEEVKGRYNGKENRLLNEGVQLYKSYIKDKLKKLKEGKYE